MHETPTLPTFDDVLAAAARIAPHAHVTPVLHSRALDASTGASLAFKGEHLQRVGAFKFRGACNAVWSLDDATAARGVVTHSSGNHGGALARAAASRLAMRGLAELGSMPGSPPPRRATMTGAPSHASSRARSPAARARAETSARRWARA